MLVLAAVFFLLILALFFAARAGGDRIGDGGARQVVSAASTSRPRFARLATRLHDERPAKTRHEIRSAICSVFTGTRCGPAIRVATCETGGTLYPRALGRAGERGLFQIHPVHFRTFDRRRLFEILYNVRAAFRLSRGGRDWSPWTCQP